MRASCIICSDIFNEISPISAAPCGHVYHSSCLSLWVAQSQTCPHCRARITHRNIQTLYFNFPSASVTNSSMLENEVLDLKAQLCAKNIELQECKKEKDDTVAFVREAEKRAYELQQTAYKNESEILDLRLRIKSLSKLEAKVLKLEQMIVALTNDLQSLNNVQVIVNGSQKDVENILKEYNNGSEAAKQLATYCTCLKRELQKVIESKSKLLELNSKLKRDNGLFAAKVKFYEDAMAISSDSVDKSVEKSANFTSGKKASLFNSEPNTNNSQSPDMPSTSTHKNSCEVSMNVSPLTISLGKSKFNMCIKTSNVTYRAHLDNHDRMKPPSIPLWVVKEKNDESIIRTGYNGLGGHSKFINIPSHVKNIKSLKRKA